MVIEVFAANARTAVGVGIVAPDEDASLRDIIRQEIAEPVGAIARRPRLFAVAVEAMHGDDATEVSQGHEVRCRRSSTRKTDSTTGSTPSATISRPWGHRSSTTTVPADAASTGTVGSLKGEDEWGSGGSGPPRREGRWSSRDKRDERDDDMVDRQLVSVNTATDTKDVRESFEPTDDG